MWTDIKDDLVKLPLLIKDKEEELYRLRKEIDELELQRKTIADIVYMDVYHAKKDGKDIYTNEKLRTEEHRKRLLKGQDYQDLIKTIKEKSEKLKPEEINLYYLKRKFRAIESLTRM